MDLTFTLDASLAQPMYEQLYERIASQISSGLMPQGRPLPSRRALSRHLGISESTVSAAYELLRSEGYIKSRDRSGYYVNPLEPLPGKPAQVNIIKAQEKQDSDRFDFSTSATDGALFPYQVWAKLFRQTLYMRPELLARGGAQGDIELRLALSAFLEQYRGLKADPEHIIIGAGADYLLSVLLQLLPRGTIVAAEDPGYHGIYRNCKRLSLTAVPIPQDAQGMSASALARSGAAVCHITPSHQFPLGLSMPVGRRAELLRWASERPDRVIIEDDYDSEFRHFSRPLPALQGLDAAGRVAYIGTFSRSLAPSMRLAYMVLPPALLSSYRESQIKSGETVSRFEQQTLARFIAEGYYARHLRRAGNAYAARLKVLLALLLDIPGSSVSGQQAGLHFLLTVPQLSEHLLIQRAANAGIRLHGLSEYCRKEKAPPSTLVLGFAGLKDGELEEAVGSLREAWGL